MLLMQVPYPNQITFIRGNHQNRQITQVLHNIGSGVIVIEV